jgi:type IV pilus assembly protein PilN
MRVPINLASEPFRRDRPMIAASVAVGALLVGLLVMLVFLAKSERDRARESRQSIARTEAQLKTIGQQRARLEAVLRQQENAEVLDRSVFLNDLLARKGVSWTKIFNDLEQVTPANVRLITVRPQINANNSLLLDMVVGSQSAESILNFVMKLEASNVFGKTTVHTTLPPSQTDPLFRSRVSVNYAQKL